MNVDVCLPYSPSNCRKLLLMRKVFKMTLSDEIVRMAELDCITQEQLDKRLPAQLTAPYFQEDSLLKFIQHAVDYEGRFVNVGSDTMKNLMASTLYSIFVGKPLIVRETPAHTKTLKTLLDNVGVSHQTISNETDEFDRSKQVTFLRTKDISDEFVSQTRDRILHINPKCTDFSGARTSSYSQAFGFSTSKPYDETVNEYYHSLISFNLNDNIYASDPEQISAVKLHNLIGVLSPLFPEISFDRLLMPKKPVMESNQGVKILNPYHITKAFGVYYGLFNPSQEGKND